MPRLAESRWGCYRCAYVWRSTSGRQPRMCPRCKSRLWDVPKLKPVLGGGGHGILEIIGTKRGAILRAANQRGFDHVRVFGSVARSRASSRSDVDFLVHPRHGVSGFDQAALELDLERILHRKVDVVPDRALHWLSRPQVLVEAVDL